MSDTRKITPQPWMTAPQTLALIEALGDAGIAARFVGGCVRDALLGVARGMAPEPFRFILGRAARVARDN